MQLVTPAVCHYLSIIVSSNDQDLSWLITVFSQVLTSPKLIYVYINIFLFTILPLSFNLDLAPFFTWFSHLSFTFCKINIFNSVILSHLTILFMLFLHLCVIIYDVIIVSFLSVWLHFRYKCTTFSSPLHRRHLTFYTLSLYALFSIFPMWTCSRNIICYSKAINIETMRNLTAVNMQNFVLFATEWVISHRHTQRTNGIALRLNILFQFYNIPTCTP